MKRRKIAKWVFPKCLNAPSFSRAISAFIYLFYTKQQHTLPPHYCSFLKVFFLFGCFKLNNPQAEQIH